MKCLAQIVRVRTDADLTATVYDVALPLITDPGDNEDMDIDRDAGSEDGKLYVYALGTTYGSRPKMLTLLIGKTKLLPLRLTPSSLR